MSRVDEMEEMYVKRIVMLAQEIETEDPIDWGMLNISEDNAYNLIALNVVNQFKNERDIMITTITKLVVENFALNLKIQEGKNNVNA
jgi:hypothetical protein